MSRAGTTCVLGASVLLLCAGALGSASAQGLQLRKQTKTAPIPAATAQKPIAKPTELATPAALTATQLFNAASPSVVVVKATDKDGNVLATGSGVVVAHGSGDFFTVATNCHVVDAAGSDGEPVIKTDSGFGLGEITRRDTARDVCLVLTYLRKTDAAGNFIRSDGRFVYPPAPPVARIAPLRSLEIGERVYAIGAPQGLELSLSEGLVSGLRKDGGTTLIQTTAAISKGSSGGGLFDAQGRLVGITTMYLKDSQALNFAVPAELIASVPQVQRDNTPPAVGVAEMSPDQLRARADKAYGENRLYSPAGNNALEFYLTLLDKEPGDGEAASAVSDLLPMTVIAAEQYVVRGDFVEANRVVALIQRADASHPALSRLRGGIAAAETAAAAADAAAATVAPPPRDRWAQVGGGDSFTTYVDTQTLQRNGGDVTVWIRNAYDKPKTDKAGDTYDEALNLSTYHCASRQYTKKVASQRLRGKPVWSYEYKSYEQERKSIMPDTVGEVIMEAVCNDL